MDEPKKLNYETDCLIDLNKLEDDWERQPHLFGEYSKNVSSWEHKRDKCKARLEIAKTDLVKAKANLEIKIRNNPLNYNCPLKKTNEPNVTENWVSAALLLFTDKDEETAKANENLKDVSEELININYELSMAQHALDGIGTQKKIALENEGKLWLGGYWSTPRAAKEIPKVVPASESVEKQRAALDASNPVVRKRRG